MHLPAPPVSDIGLARNALVLLGRHRPQEALETVEGIEAPTPFSEIVHALAILDMFPEDLAAADARLGKIAEAPDYLWHLIPWHASFILPKKLPDGYGKQEAISLRLLKRPDLAGRLVRRAHAIGLRGSNGRPFLAEVPETAPASGLAVCLIDGAEVKSLATHIAGYNVSPKAYRDFFGI